MSDESQPDTRPAVIVLGSVQAGFEFYGPWESVDAAVAAIEKMVLKPNMTIALLRPCAELPFQTKEKP